ncbi:MAG: GNAT family N-acetyltransferase [Rickettsiales bacterium]|nr:GNAT family N-acetyltransferase [Rickettsiales bacterium]
MNNYELLSELHKECFPSKPWPAGEFKNLQKAGCEIIASENAFIVWRAVADEAEIITLGVRPSARRTGAAAALLSVTENELRKRNIKKIFLEVSADNWPAIKLYEKSDFARAGVRRKYYAGIDGIMMTKDLQPAGRDSQAVIPARAGMTN